MTVSWFLECLFTVRIVPIFYKLKKKKSPCLRGVSHEPNQPAMRFKAKDTRLCTLALQSTPFPKGTS